MLRRLRHFLGFFVREARVAYLRLMGIRIGRDVFISWGAWIDVRNGEIEIGDRAALTNGCKVLSHDHARHIMGFRGKVKTAIGDDVFIGMNAIILPGVSVGNGSIIGAGTVVTKNIPPNSLVVGRGGEVIKRLDPVTGKWTSV